METAYLHEFAKVADCGSFTAAARELHLTQSTLSKHVALLEREFGADLFVRDRSGVSLTEAGGVLYAQARQMEKLLRATELLVRAARDGQGSAGAGGCGRDGGRSGGRGCRRRLACGRVRHGASLQVPARGRALRARPARAGRAHPVRGGARLRDDPGRAGADARRGGRRAGQRVPQAGRGRQAGGARFHPFRFGMMVDAPAAVGHTA